MTQPIEKLLAIAPGVLLIIGASGLAPLPLAISVLLLALSYVILIYRAGRLPLWSLTGISLGMSLLLTHLLWAALPEPSGWLRAAALVLAMGITFRLGWGVAKEEGGAAVLSMSAWIGLAAYGIGDPSYALTIWYPDLQLWHLNLIDTAMLIPLFILMPIWLLHAKTPRTQLWAVGVSAGLAILVDLGAGMARAIGVASTWSGQQNSSLLAEISAALQGGLIFGAIVVGLYLLITIIYARRKDQAGRGGGQPLAWPQQQAT
ncbi:MAG: hypothetical protein GYB68_00695 [Chloroflexi bacterium]|nr:hypothetical protein [Chloroflexota bacterium]